MVNTVLYITDNTLDALFTASVIFCIHNPTSFTLYGSSIDKNTRNYTKNQFKGAPPMSLYVIADLHLSGAVNKSMDVFGRRWAGYTDRIKSNWAHLVNEDDTVIVPGDISWGMTLEEALPDFKFIDSLPGKKYLMKGNHDFWWNTLSKTERFFIDNGITSIELLQNNAVRCESFILCGSRGWFSDEKNQNTVGTPDFNKIIARETIRLKMSLEAAVALKRCEGEEIISFFHFPPALGSFECTEFTSLLKEYGVRRCYFGHIHDPNVRCGEFLSNGIEMNLISADYLGFVPKLIVPKLLNI